MDYLITIKKSKIEDIKKLLSALARSPYIGGVIALISAMIDLIDLIKNIFKKKSKERQVILKATCFRLGSHTLMGLGGLFPLVTIASFMVAFPFIIPLVAFIPILADLYKFFNILTLLKNHLKEDEFNLKQTPCSETLKKYQETKKFIHGSKRELITNVGLFIGTLICAVGFFFPPLLIAGIGLGIACTLINFLDKRYQISERIVQWVFEDETIKYRKTPTNLPLKKSSTATFPCVQQHSHLAYTHCEYYSHVGVYPKLFKKPSHAAYRGKRVLQENNEEQKSLTYSF